MTLVPIPPATRGARRLCEEIRTSLLTPQQGGWVVATYETRRKYASPLDAPMFAVMKWTRVGGWEGHVRLQTFSDREDCALRELLDTLRTVGLSKSFPALEWAQLESVVHDLSHVTLSTPWAQRPFPQRGRKPRRKRLKWRTHDGSGDSRGRIHIYVDTMKPHADPNCPCMRCRAVEPPTPDDEDESTTTT